MIIKRWCSVCCSSIWCNTSQLLFQLCSTYTTVSTVVSWTSISDIFTVI